MNPKKWITLGTGIALVILTGVVGWVGRDRLATRLDLEELVAIVALTTFLVGFSTVRLQTRLEEFRAGVARHTDRVLEQNNQADMLPLPSEMRELKSADRFNARDNLAVATECFSIFNLLLSLLLVFFHWRFYEDLPQYDRDPRYSYVGYVLILAFHLFVVALGSFASFSTNRQAQQEEEESVFRRYSEFEESLEKWLKKPDDSLEELKRRCDRLDEALPSWTWLILVRAAMKDDRGDTSSLKRVRNLAAREKHQDDYSLIAYIWSAYLTDSLDDAKSAFSASALIRLEELKQIAEFAKSCDRQNDRSGRIYAGLALRDAKSEVEKRGMAIELEKLFDVALERTAGT